MGGGSDADRLRAEYDDQTESEFRSEIYRQLEWVRFEHKWKAGWTAWTFKDLFGRWPDTWMKSLKPYPACEAVEKLIRRRVRLSTKQFKEAKERERDTGKAVSGSVAPSPGEGRPPRGNGKLENGSRIEVMARGGGDEGKR